MIFSGVAVAIGLLALVVLPVPFLRSIGYGGMLIPLVSVLVAIDAAPGDARRRSGHGSTARASGAARRAPARAGSRGAGSSCSAADIVGGVGPGHPRAALRPGLRLLDRHPARRRAGLDRLGARGASTTLEESGIGGGGAQPRTRSLVVARRPGRDGAGRRGGRRGARRGGARGPALAQRRLGDRRRLSRSTRTAGRRLARCATREREPARSWWDGGAAGTADFNDAVYGNFTGSCS